jgi:hypothetical protein
MIFHFLHHLISNLLPPRRFPAAVDRRGDGRCFIVKDSNRRALALATFRRYPPRLVAC